MAKYLRPRRGSKDSAFAQQILLKKGEMFLEFPNSEIGRGPGRLVIGDGATSYQNMNYSSTATNVFRPFITDPELFVPRFDNSTYQTSGWTVDAGTEAINAMGDGSSASTVAIPTLIGNIKNALCKHANSVIKLNNDLANKADKTLATVDGPGLMPKLINTATASSGFLSGDGTWHIPKGTTYANATTDSHGLMPRLNSGTITIYTGETVEKGPNSFLKGNGSWGYWATTASCGLIKPLLTQEQANTDYIPAGYPISTFSRGSIFLGADGNWHTLYNSIRQADESFKGLMAVDQVKKLNDINTTDIIPGVSFGSNGHNDTFHYPSETVKISKKGRYTILFKILTHIDASSGVAPIVNNKYGDVRISFGRNNASTATNFCQIPVVNYDQKVSFVDTLYVDDEDVGTYKPYVKLTYGPDGTENATTVVVTGRIINLTAIDPFE